MQAVLALLDKLEEDRDWTLMRCNPHEKLQSMRHAVEVSVPSPALFARVADARSASAMGLVADCSPIEAQMALPNINGQKLVGQTCLVIHVGRVQPVQAIVAPA